MPTYDYRCDDCGYFFEEFQSMKDEKLTKCPECGKETLRRLIGTGSGLIFKGTGFYLTDYKNKNTETSSSKSDRKSDQKSESESKKNEGGEKDKSSKEDTKTSTDKKESKPTSSDKKSSAAKTE